MSKSYGLILPTNKKIENVPAKADFAKPSIFGSDSDSDGGGAPKRLTVAGPGLNEKRQARKIQEKALEEDPTIFQYDELYDDIENKREEDKKSKSTEVKKPKYISRLLESAERRKVENKRRIERMVQKERELEGEQFKDKESFVTAAYRKTLEEFKKAEEREEREAYLESIGDVTKQQDLGGFYRHLYEQKLGPKDIITKDKESVEPAETETSTKTKSIRPRTYRKRRSSAEEDEEEDSATITKAKKAHLQSNLDADSDFSIDSSSSDNEGDPEDTNKTKKQNSAEVDTNVFVKPEPISIEPNSPQKKEEIKDIISQNDIKKENDGEGDEKIKVEKKPKIDKEAIWRKRTIGDVFDSALQRYYERKAARNG